MSGDIYPDQSATFKFFTKNGISSVSEDAIDKKVIEALVKRDLSKLEFLPISENETTSDYLNSGDIQINSKEQDTNEVFAIYAKHNVNTVPYNQTNIKGTSVIGSINDTLLSKNVTVDQESATFFNSHVNMSFSDDTNIYNSTSGNYTATLDNTDINEYNAFKAANYSGSRKGVSGDDTHGLRVSETGDYNINAYLSEKLISRESDGKLSASPHPSTVISTPQTGYVYTATFTRTQVYNNIYNKGSDGDHIFIFPYIAVNNATSSSINVGINNDGTQTPGIDSPQIASLMHKFTLINGKLLINVIESPIITFPEKITMPGVKIVYSNVGGNVVCQVFYPSNPNIYNGLLISFKLCTDRGSTQETIYANNLVNTTIDIPTSSVIPSETIVNGRGYIVEIPDNTIATKPLIQGAIKIIQDPSGLSVTLQPDGQANDIALTRQDMSPLPTIISRDEFQNYFTTNDFLNVGNKYSLLIQGQTGGGYSVNGFRGVNSDDSAIAKNITYMNFCRGEGNNFTNAPHTVEFTNGSTSLSSAISQDVNLSSMFLSDSDELLNGSQYTTNGYIDLKLSSNNPFESNVTLNRWDYISNTVSSMGGLEVTYFKNEWGSDPIELAKRGDMNIAYKENSVVNFKPVVLVANTRDSQSIGGNLFNGTYERSDVTGSNVPVAMNVVNNFVHKSVMHVGKSNNFAAIVPAGENSTLNGTELTLSVPYDNFNNVFDANNRLTIIKMTRVKNIVQESEAYSSVTRAILPLRSELIAKNVDLANLIDSNGATVKGRDARLVLTPKLPSDLGIQFVNSNPGAFSVVTSAYKITNPTDPLYQPELITYKSSSTQSLMRANASLIASKPDDHRIEVAIKLYSTDSTSADYVRNNITLSYVLKDGSGNTVLSGSQSIPEQEFIDDVAPTVVIESESTVANTQIQWTAPATSALYILKRHVQKTTRTLRTNLNIGTYKNLQILCPPIEVSDTIYTVYENSTGRPKPDHYLSLVNFINGSVVTPVTFTRKYSSTGFNNMNNVDEINETMIFKPSALSGLYGQLESKTLSGNWVSLGTKSHVDIAHDVVSNINVQSASGTGEITFTGDLVAGYAVGTHTDGVYYLELTTPSSYSGVNAFDIETRMYEITSALDLNNWSGGVYSQYWPTGGNFNTLPSYAQVSYIDTDGNPLTQPKVVVNIRGTVNGTDVLLAKLESPETFVADVNIVRCLGTIMRSEEIIGNNVTTTSTVKYSICDVETSKEFSLIHIGSDAGGNYGNSGVRLAITATALRGHSNTYKLLGQKVQAILYQGTPSYSGSLSALDTELTNETGLIASDSKSRNLNFKYFRGYNVLYDGVNTYSRITLNRVPTQIRMRVKTPLHNFVQELSNLYLGSSHTVSNLVDSSTSSIMGNLNLKFTGNHSMFSSTTNTIVPLVLSYSKYSLDVINPLNLILNKNLSNVPSSEFSGMQYANGRSIVVTRIVTYQPIYYSLYYGVPLLKIYHSPSYVGDVKTFTDWTPYPVTEFISDDILRQTNTFLKVSPTDLRESAVRLQRVSVNVENNTKYFVCPPAQLKIEAVCRNQIVDVPYNASAVTRRSFYADLQNYNTPDTSFFDFTLNSPLNYATTQQMNKLVLKQNGTIKNALLFRTQPDSTLRYFNIRSNNVAIELYTGLYPAPGVKVDQSTYYNGAIYNGPVDELVSAHTNNPRLLATYDANLMKYKLEIKQSLVPVNASSLPNGQIEDIIANSSYNLIYTGVMPHMTGTLNLNNYTGDSVSWGVIGGTSSRTTNGDGIVYKFSKYESSYGTDLSTYFGTTQGNNLKLVPDSKKIMSYTINAPQLTDTPYDMLNIIKNTDFTSMVVNWVNDPLFNASKGFNFAIKPLSLKGKDEITSLFNVHLKQPYNLLLAHYPNFLTILKSDGTVVASIGANGMLVSHSLGIFPWDF